MFYSILRMSVWLCFVLSNWMDGNMNTVIMREMAPIGEMAPGCEKRSKKEIVNCIFAPPSERWHRVRSQRCKSKSECYRTGPTPRECCCLQFERHGVAPSPSCWPGPFDCEAWLWVLAFLGAFVVVICCQNLVHGFSCCQMPKGPQSKTQ